MSDAIFKMDIGASIFELSKAIRYLADRHYDSIKLQMETMSKTQEKIANIYQESVDGIMEKK